MLNNFLENISSFISDPQIIEIINKIKEEYIKYEETKNTTVLQNMKEQSSLISKNL